MKTNTIILSIAALLLFSSTGCQKHEDPAPYVPAKMTANMSIMEFKGLYPGQPYNIPSYSDIVLAGKVISTDRHGNFYRSFFIQDTTANGGGIEIKLGLTGMYNDYKVGQIVYVKPNGLCLGRYGGLLNIGYRSLNPRYETAFIDVPAIIKATIFRGEQSTPVAPVDIFTAADLTDARYGTWVTLKEARYQGGSYFLNGTTHSPWDKWAKKPDTLDDDTAYGEQRFLLADGSTVVVVRSSGYAKFADNVVPFAVNQKVNVTGVLTRYNNIIQLMLNTDADAVAVP